MQTAYGPGGITVTVKVQIGWWLIGWWLIGWAISLGFVCNSDFIENEVCGLLCSALSSWRS